MKKGIKMANQLKFTKFVENWNIWMKKRGRESVEGEPPEGKFGCGAGGCGGRAPRVLFVCLGNICRSPAAQGIAEKIARERGLADYGFDSAGFYGGHRGDLPDRRMREAAWQRGYGLNTAAARCATAISPISICLSAWTTVTSTRSVRRLRQSRMRQR